jgi:hypothetical protein
MLWVVRSRMIAERHIVEAPSAAIVVLLKAGERCPLPTNERMAERKRSQYTVRLKEVFP